MFAFEDANLSFDKLNNGSFTNVNEFLEISFNNSIIGNIEITDDNMRKTYKWHYKNEEFRFNSNDLIALHYGLSKCLIDK